MNVEKTITTQFSQGALCYLADQYTEFESDIEAFENVMDCKASDYFGKVEDIEEAVTTYLYHELDAIRLENGNILVPVADL